MCEFDARGKCALLKVVYNKNSLLQRGLKDTKRKPLGIEEGRAASKSPH